MPPPPPLPPPPLPQPQSPEAQAAPEVWSLPNSLRMGTRGG
eukprot:CAMPEP_0173311020 /NCGR_PEP_ID=MMETSP1143-20121109/23272_1 /TAXON_ID=483371 /ORGANISM="non described non described, Strain CCMP2298" /LENGTH=40 /DNA_ID= /DNA_START= /DNA_END= /DNA_ORIENTATION=